MTIDSFDDYRSGYVDRWDVDGIYVVKDDEQYDTWISHAR
jgi:hypothetical protein